MTNHQLFSKPSGDESSQAPPVPNRRRSLPAWLVPVVLVLAFAGVFAFVFADRLLPSKQVEVAPVILLADIERDGGHSAESAPEDRAADEVELDYSGEMLFQAAGWLEPDPLPIRATALVDGVVEEVFVLEGEEVKKGQVLAQLISEDSEIHLEAAERKHEQTVAEHHMHLANIPAVSAEAASLLEQVKSAEARLDELVDKRSRLDRLSAGTVSEQEMTAARLAVDAQEAKVASLKSDRAAVLARLEAINVQSSVFDAMIAAAKVSIADKKLALERTKIPSPVDGVVLELKAAPGQKKMLGMDDPDSATIAVLFERGKLQARVDVPLADARGLVPGQAAIITSDFLPNAEFKGVVSRIVGSADLQRNTLQAKVRVIDPDPRLRPEMLCRVKFLAGAGTDSPLAAQARGGAGDRAVMAPLDCLFGRSGSSARAWVVARDGSSVTRRQVELGSLELDGHISIASGLLAGERLVRPPHDGLSEGRRIAVGGQH